jgi:MOSC domain-containing protein YiiM
MAPPMRSPLQAPSALSGLRSTFPRTGRVEWIGLRPGRRAALASVPSAQALAGTGLDGDHARGGRRAVTLIQHEHLAVVAALAGRPGLEPSVLRRNVCVSGINLLALRDARFRMGGLLLEGTGICAPCSRMDADDGLGPGGFNAMRGHGGITARVLEGGSFALGDPVVFVGLVAETAPVQGSLLP